MCLFVYLYVLFVQFQVAIGSGKNAGILALEIIGGGACDAHFMSKRLTMMEVSTILTIAVASLAAWPSTLQ